MHNKKIFILITLGLALVFSFVFFNLKKDDTDQLRLCANDYLETEYDLNGKIVIKNWPWDKSGQKNKLEQDGSVSEPRAFDTFYEASEFLSLDYIKDLACVQKIELYGGTDFKIPWAEDENIEKLASLINLEEIYINMDSIPGGDINVLFNHLTKLKTIFISMGGPTLMSFENVEKLKNLKELTFELQNPGFESFDFENLPNSIEKLSIGHGYGEIAGVFKNGNYITKLTHLKELNLPEQFILENEDSFCGWVSSFKYLEKIQNINIEQFNCEKWVDELYRPGQG